MNDVSEFYPIRRGGRIFVKVGGVETELHPLQAAIIAREWFGAMTGAYAATLDRTTDHEHLYCWPYDRHP